MKSREVVITNASGLHARPATFFIQKANCYKCTILVEKDDRKVNAKSLLGVLSLGIAKGMTVKLSAEEYKTLLLTYMIPETTAREYYTGELFLCAGERTLTEAGISKWIPELPADGAWHTISIDLAADFWHGDIHSIRLDFFNAVT